MIRIVIIGGEELLRNALAARLAHEPDLTVLAALASGEPADGTSPRPNVAVIDLDDREHDGLATSRRLASAHPPCRVLALTEARRPDLLRAALAADVRGLVGKDDPPERLARWIRRIAGGERVIDPALAADLLRPVENRLTARERAALRLAAAGMPSGEIAQRLHLAPGTVRNYLSAAMRKTGARNRLEAARRAEDAGWL